MVYAGRVDRLLAIANAPIVLADQRRFRALCARLYRRLIGRLDRNRAHCEHARFFEFGLDQGQMTARRRDGMDVNSAEYARVELMGHVDLGICKIREVDSLGGKSLEVTELLKDGSDGVVRLVEKAALYMRTAVSKEEAMKDAAERWRPETNDEPMPPPKGDPPIPWESIVRVLEYLGPAEKCGALEEDVRRIAGWFEAVTDDIPF